MSKGKNFESLKIPFVKTCPICGEKYYKRVTKKGKTKGLDLNFVSKETFFLLHYYYEYHCYTCGIWMARKISVTENNRIGTSYMYPNETINPKHHVPKSINNNQTKNYGVCM